MNNAPFVSIIIPCYNEERFIEKCLDSIVTNNYPNDKLEVIVVDGFSKDKTRHLVKKFIYEHSFITLMNNPKKIAPVAQNIGIKNARGEIIMIMDAHATYDNKYILRCVRVLKEYDADNVGGILKTIPQDDTLIGKAISTVLSHPFGVGNSRFRIGRYSNSNLKFLETVPYGCFKKNIFNEIGLFDENLVRSYDLDFNKRIKKRGGKIILIPDISVYYYARSRFLSFCKHNFLNGIWVTYPLKFKKIVFSWRHLVPLIFVSSLLFSFVLLFFSPFFLWISMFILAAYLILIISFTGNIVCKEKEIRFLLIIPLILASLHFLYGVGSFWGGIKLLIPSKQ